MRTLPVVLTCALLTLASAQSGWGAIENDAYRVDTEADGSVRVTQKASGASDLFRPVFKVLYSASSPGYAAKTLLNEYGWGFYSQTWSGSPDLFDAPATLRTFTAAGWTQETGVVRWTFASQDGMQVEARVSAPAGSGEPALWFQVRAGAAGYHSIGYAGAPERATNAVDWVWQPMVWQGLRVPTRSFLTPEHLCTLPAVMMGYSNRTVGVAVDPVSLYNPYADPNQAILDGDAPGGFGVALRNAAGRLQPMVFAPIYGRSSLAAGGTASLTVRLAVRSGAWYDSYKSLALGLYGFRDYRQNGLCSLNATLDNMVDYILGPYGHWMADYKCWSYEQDMPGWGRQQSAADAVSLAFVRDDRTLFDRLALPTVEYEISRNSKTFALSSAYDPDHAMGGWLEPYDLTATYQLSGGRCTVLRQLVEPGLPTAPTYTISRAKNTMAGLLARHRLTGDPAALAAAEQTAANYIAARIDRPPADRSDSEGSFWYHVGPGWYLMNELYDETGKDVYRDAFVRGIREFTAFTFLQPAAPAADITVKNYITGGTESVPAWRVDPRGLTSECTSTMHSHRTIFMPPFASYLLRAGHYGEDPFLRAIGRAAVVGRYANYPGYAYRDQMTASYEKPEWPLRSYSAIRSHITMHFNHPLPMCTYLVEYLVADAAARSDEQIRFPSGYSYTSGGYFMHKVYGAGPGRFYGDTNVWLWLPKALVATDSVQLNYVAGHGNGALYLALMNQSTNPVTTSVALNAALVPLAGTRSVRIWQDNVAQADAAMTDGRMTVTVAPMGIAALAVAGAGVGTALQGLRLEDAPAALPADCYRLQTGTPFGKVGGQLLSFGRRLTSAYVWLEAHTGVVTRATLHHASAAGWKTVTDTKYPFEFTVALPDNATSFRFYVTGLTPAGGTVSNSTVQLGSWPDPEPPQPIQPGGRGYRTKIGFPGYRGAGSLTNFPALVVLGPDIPGFNYAQFLSPRGHDLRLRDAADTTDLAYEIERWDTNGDSCVWVRIPRLDADTSVWMHWGDAEQAVRPPCTTNGAVWSEGFEAVWHLSETPAGAVLDSTANRHGGATVALAGGDQVTGRAGGALSFDGATKYIALDGDLLLPANGPFALSAWARPAGTPNYPGLLCGATGLTNSFRLYTSAGLVKPRLVIQGSNKLFNSATPRDGSTWTHLSASRAADGSGTLRFYQNGMDDTSGAPASTNAFAIRYLGRGHNVNDANRNWNGLLDEVRVSRVARSADWFRAEFDNVASNADFNRYAQVAYSLCATAGVGGAVSAPAIGWHTPGSTVCVTAAPARYFSWAGWSGDVEAGTAAANPLTVAMDRPRSVAASFEAVTASRGTPAWWLAQHGWTNDFDAAEELDADDDGHANWQEYIAGTHPRDGASVLRARGSPGRAGSAWCVLSWPSEAGRVYDVERTGELLAGFSDLAWGLTATPPLNVFTDACPSTPGAFYRVSAQRE